MPLTIALESLLTQKGKETHLGDWLAISQDRIDQFAEATDDYQWIHVDPEKAKLQSPYGTTIAHGYLTLSLIVSLTKTNQNDDKTTNFEGLKMAINYGLNKVRFPAPVKVGERIRARTILKEVDVVKDCLQLSREVTIEIENSEKPACVAETVSRLYFHNTN